MKVCALQVFSQEWHENDFDISNDEFLILAHFLNHVHAKKWQHPPIKKMMLTRYHHFEDTAHTIELVFILQRKKTMRLPSGHMESSNQDNRVSDVQNESHSDSL